MFEKIKQYFKELFSKKSQPITAPSIPSVSSDLADQLIKLCLEDVGMRETNGNNRSKLIDEMNKAAGVEMGSPYCITGILYRGVKRLCDNNKLKMPLHIEASTQDFWNMVPAKYKRVSGIKAKAGDIGIMQSRIDSSRGHAYLLTADETENQKTVEYNTDPTGGRDGDGCYTRVRTQSGDLSKKYLGAVDIIKWISDINNIPKKETFAPPQDTKPISSMKPLSWEENHPERREWSEYLYKMIDTFYFDRLNKAKDFNKLTNGKSLSRHQTIMVWCELFSSISYYESMWNPKSASVDVGSKEDKGSWSIGLMQVSVNDQEWSENLDYSYDDLLTPLPNLHLALALMAFQIGKTGLIFLDNSDKYRYWSVLLYNNKYSKIDKIISAVKKLTF